MEWSEFTRQNIKQFKNYRYKLNNSNLLQFVRTERDRIKQFIKNNKKIVVEYDSLNKNQTEGLNKKIKEYAKTSWVDTKAVVQEMSKMDKNIVYQWKSIVDSDEKPTLNNVFIKSNTKNIKNTNKKIKLIAYIIEYLKHKNDHVNKSVNIYLVLTQLKKYFPESNNIMDIKNANTGYTDFGKDIIFIWRNEELEKVIFHEICHYCDLDKREHHVDHIAIINGPHSYYEAITDLLGIVYHLIFLSLLTRTSIKYLLEIELGFIKNQAMFMNDYFKLGNWKNGCDSAIKQTTPAFSYYIIKYMIFEYLLDHDLIDYHHYNDLISNISKIGFKQEPYIKINSSRMTLLQLN